MGKFRSENTISGKEGRLFFDGEELAYVKEFEATVTKNKSDVPVVGQRWTGKKATGLAGEGSMTLYKVTSKFIRLMKQYEETGEDAYFTLQGVLDDKGSGRGTERTTLYRVNIDSTVIAQLNADGEPLEEEVPFTFEGFDTPETLRDDF